MRPLKQKADKLEQQLAQLNDSLEQVEGQLSDSALYEADNKDRLKQALDQQAEIKRELSEIEEAWLEALEVLEAAEFDACQ